MELVVSDDWCRLEREGGWNWGILEWEEEVFAISDDVDCLGYCGMEVGCFLEAWILEPPGPGCYLEQLVGLLGLPTARAAI